MDVAPHNIIKLADDFFPAVANGGKRLTIRKGVRQYTLGAAKFEATGGTHEPVQVFICELSCSFLVDVSDEDARADGFKNAGDLAGGLRRFYPDLKDTDMVTLVHFSVPTAPR